MIFNKEARPFKIVFDEAGIPSVENSYDCVLYSNKTIGPSDMSAVIIEQSPNAQHVGVEPDKWLRAFCERTIGPLPPNARHLRAREPIPEIDGPGFISGVLVRDVA